MNRKSLKYLIKISVVIFILATYMVTLTTCATSPKRRYSVKNTSEIDIEAQTYIADFKDSLSEVVSESKYKIVKISMADIFGGAIGLCRSGVRPKHVYIDRNWWASASHIQREALIWHELAHCMCEMGHGHFLGDYKGIGDFASGPTKERFKNGFLADGCPATHMYPSITPDYCLIRYRQFYKYEIYLQCYAIQKYKE